MKDGQFEDYFNFIMMLQNKINKHFENQKEYIHCKEGCDMCCSEGQYPCSELEFEFLKIGFSLLDESTKQQIFENIDKLKKDFANFKGEKFLYACPFLINHRCSVYNFRMIICRTFGLPFFVEENGKNRLKVPFCVERGLNYSEVYDAKKNIFTTELFKKMGYKNEPLASNFGLDFIINKLGTESMKLDFGEEKTLVDWL